MRILNRGSTAAIPSEAKRISKNNSLFIITGSQSNTHPNIKQVLDQLNQTFECRHYVVQSWLATIEEYESFKKTFQETEPGCLVAIGGGRIMDFAKLIGTGLQTDTIRQKIKDNQPIIRDIPLIAVPTTAGSGAEATPYAVFYFSGEKYTISHPSLLPDSEIIDPDLLETLSPQQLAISGADAICQAVESIFSPSATEKTLLISRAAFTVGIPALKACVQGNSEFSELLCWASNMAGQAITHVRTNVPHALSYYLTSHHKVPHGQAVAFYVGAYLEEMITNVKASQSSTTLKETCAALEAILKAQNGMSIEESWHSFLLSIGLKPYFTHPDASRICSEIVKSANIERLQNLVVPLNIEKIIGKSIRIN